MFRHLVQKWLLFEPIAIHVSPVNSSSVISTSVLCCHVPQLSLKTVQNYLHLHHPFLQCVLYTGVYRYRIPVIYSEKIYFHSPFQTHFHPITRLPNKRNIHSNIHPFTNPTKHPSSHPSIHSTIHLNNYPSNHSSVQT